MSDHTQLPGGRGGDWGPGDDLRTRLDHLGRAATVGSRPWPGVDAAIRQRKQRTAAVAAAALTIVVLLTATLLTRTTSQGPAPRPARQLYDGLGYVPYSQSRDTPAQPWAAPQGPYELVYRDRRLAFPGGDELCGRRYVLDPYAPRVREATSWLEPAVIARSATCDGDRGRATFVVGAPNTSDDEDAPVPGGSDPATCAAAIRITPGIVSGAFTRGTRFCLAVPGRSGGVPPMLVYVTVDELRPDGGLGLRVTAWSGGQETTRFDQP
jgi:hypothetical protein